MASTGMRVATMGTLWMVFTREAKSSVSSYSLKSSKGLIFYIRFDLIIIFKIIINNRKITSPPSHWHLALLENNKYVDFGATFNIIFHM